jgi:hypothetical protein
MTKAWTSIWDRISVRRCRGRPSRRSFSSSPRRRAFEVLVRDSAAVAFRGDPQAASSDEEWRLTAVFAMGMIRGFEKEVAATVESARGELLFEAVRAAGRMEVTAAAPRIRALAASGKTPLELRLEAIRALPGVDRDCIDILDELSAPGTMKSPMPPRKRRPSCRFTSVESELRSRV